MLWASIALLIPILIHLFDFRRIKKTYFTNLQFLELVGVDSRPRSLLKRRLILFSRLAVITFIVLAFANPFISQTKVESSDEVIVLDNSITMLDNCSETDCLEFSEEVLSSLVDGEVTRKFYFRGGAESESLYDQADVSRVLASIHQSSVAFGSFNEIDQDTRVIIVSDFSEASLDELRGFTEQASEVLLIKIKQLPKSNLYIDSVYFDSNFGLEKNESKVICILANSGTEDLKDALVRLKYNDLQVASIAVSLSGGESQQVEFQTAPDAFGGYKIEIEDLGKQFDNEYYFNLLNRDLIQIAIISQFKNEMLSAVYANNSLFNTQNFSLEAIDFEFVNSADLLVLSGLKSIPEWVNTLAFTSHIVVIPGGDEIDITSYQNLLSKRVLIDNDTIKRKIDVKSLRNPFFSGLFSEVNDRSTLPEIEHMYNLNGISESLLSTDKTLLTRIDQENRFIYWFNTSDTELFESIGRHALFVPMMYRFAEKSVGDQVELYHRLKDEPVVLPFLPLQQENVVLRGQGRDYIPEIYSSGDQLIMLMPDEFITSGNYSLTQGADTIYSLALNYSRDLSILSSKSDAELIDFFGGPDKVSLLEATDLSSFQNRLIENREGKPLWKYALLLALMFLIAEIALHRWLN